jgi:hypothetical protein
MKTEQISWESNREYDIPEESFIPILVEAYEEEHCGYDVIHIDGDPENKDESNVYSFSLFQDYEYEQFIEDFFFRERQWKIQEILEKEVEEANLTIQRQQAEILELKNKNTN